MALLTCGDCKNEISDSASTCPHCGRLVASKTEKKASMSAGLSIGIILLPVVFAWFTLRSGYSRFA